LEYNKEKKMAFGGILGSLMGNIGLIEKGASMMGYTMPSWAVAGMGIAAETFGSKGKGGAGGGSSIQREREAKSYGGEISMGQQKMIGPGEQKASAAVEYEDELRSIEAAIRLYAEAE
jgi:hypothetical protein